MIASLLVFVLLAEGSTSQCTSQAGVITAADQQVMINITNAFRSALATGKLIDRNNVSMDKADNMLKVQWNQSLADGSQKWADCCLDNHSEIAGVGENIFMQGGSPMDVASNFIMAFNDWSAELIQNWVYRANNVFLGDANLSQPVGHFTQLAWANTFQVGCGYAQCPDLFPGFTSSVLIVCQYREEGNYLNETVYNPSKTGCVTGSVCTAASQNSTCDEEGLCSM